MSLARVLAAIAALCTGLALAAWLTLTVVVGGAMVGYGGQMPRPVDRAFPTASASFATKDATPAAAAATNAATAATNAAASDSPATPAPTSSSAASKAPAAGSETADALPPGTDGVSRLAVDWPTIPTLKGWTPITSTAHFEVFSADGQDAVLDAAVTRWTPRLERILDYVAGRIGRDLPKVPTAIVFARRYEAACPARGLAAPPDEDRSQPLVMLFIDADTSDLQIRAVLAHEMSHHLTMDDAFVGDGVLTEGIANWAAGAYALAWQGFDRWDDAARAYLRAGDYISVADTNGLVPLSGEACIARRDRVYNVRTAFVDWLIARNGLDTVLAMPKTTVPVDAGDGKREERSVPDYAAATGESLTQLERRWLAELTGVDAAAPTPAGGTP